jgi:hypothetical protein
VSETNEMSITLEAPVLAELQANDFSNLADAKPYESGPTTEDSVVITLTRGAAKAIAGQLELSLGAAGPAGTDPVRDDGQGLQVDMQRSVLEALRGAKQLATGEYEGQPVTALEFDREIGITWLDLLNKALDVANWPVLPVADQ